MIGRGCGYGELGDGVVGREGDEEGECGIGGGMDGAKRRCERWNRCCAFTWMMFKRKLVRLGTRDGRIIGTMMCEGLHSRSHSRHTTATSSISPPQPRKERKKRTTHPSKSIVLIMNPSVGLTVFTSSSMTRLTIVVLPALSRPLLILIWLASSTR